MLFLLKVIILLTFFFFYIRSPGKESSTDSQKELLNVRSHKGVQVKIPSDIELAKSAHQIKHEGSDGELSSHQMHIDQEYSLHSPSTHTLDTMSEDEEYGTSSDTLAYISHPGTPLQQNPKKYTNQQLEQIRLELSVTVESFKSTLPPGLPSDVLCTITFGLIYGLMDDFKSCDAADPNICLDQIKKSLDQSASQFRTEYMKQENTGADRIYIAYAILKSDSYMWGHLRKRSSNYPSKSIGWTIFMMPLDKLNALIIDYKVLLRDGSYEFSQIIIQMSIKISNVQTDQMLKDYLLQDIDQLQTYFSLFRYFRDKLHKYFPDIIQQRIILIISIYHLPIFEEMVINFNKILDKYMKYLHLRDLSTLIKPRLDNAAKECDKLKIFAIQANRYLQRH